MNYIFTLAEKRDIDDIFSLIEKRISWMDEKGIKGWNCTNYINAFPKAYYEEERRKGNLFVLKDKDNGEVIGAVALKKEDYLWEDDVPSLYIHNLVTHLSYSGIGRIILAKSEEEAIKNNIFRLRLDCGSDNEFLNSYYESLGYILKGECVDGPYRGNKREKLLNNADISREKEI